MVDLTEHFIVKQKSILKHQKLLLQDVTPRSWVLKNPLVGISPPLNQETASLPFTRVLRVLSANRL